MLLHPPHTIECVQSIDDWLGTSVETILAKFERKKELGKEIECPNRIRIRGVS
jgi:hypothetical protein